MNLYYKISALFCFVFFMLSCNDDRSKTNLDHVTAVCEDKIFVETYTVFNSGAFGGDRVSQYLTDSLKFRKYIGTFDNGTNFFSYKCNGDSILISYCESHSQENKILYSKSYLLTDLIKEGSHD